MCVGVSVGLEVGVVVGFGSVGCFVGECSTSILATTLASGVGISVT